MKTTPCSHLSGYWINRKAGTFRCYECGYQFRLPEIPKARGRKIETFKA